VGNCILVSQSPVTGFTGQRSHRWMGVLSDRWSPVSQLNSALLSKLTAAAAERKTFLLLCVCVCRQVPVSFNGWTTILCLSGLKRMEKEVLTLFNAYFSNSSKAAKIYWLIDQLIDKKWPNHKTVIITYQAIMCYLASFRCTDRSEGSQASHFPLLPLFMLSYANLLPASALYFTKLNYLQLHTGPMKYLREIFNCRSVK